MGYFSERASKINYQYIIRDDKIKNYLNECYILLAEETIQDNEFLDLSTKIEVDSDQISSNNSIETIIAVDGGYQIVSANQIRNTSQKYSKGSKVAYISIGALEMDLENLKKIESNLIIDPVDIGKLQKIKKRYSLLLPVAGISHKNKNLVDTIRERIFEIFKNEYLFPEGKTNSFLETIKWLIFEQYLDINYSEKISRTCHTSGCEEIILFSRGEDLGNEKDDWEKKICPKCKSIIYITDIFQLDTLVNEFEGAEGIVSYLMSLFEVIFIISMIKFFLELKNKDSGLEYLSKILFIKDGSLALYSRLDDFSYRKIRKFIKYLYNKSLENRFSLLNLVGLEKSGRFVEHLDHLRKTHHMENKTLFLPNKHYIHHFITGESDTAKPYGYTTYFGIKTLYKYNNNFAFEADFPFPFIKISDDKKEDYSVATMTKQYSDYIKNPRKEDILNLENILNILCYIKCDLYSNSSLPVVLVNKGVSLAQSSTQFLTRHTHKNLNKK